MSGKYLNKPEGAEREVSDEDTADSLDIKPPQAQRLRHKSSKKSKDKRRAIVKHKQHDNYEKSHYKTYETDYKAYEAARLARFNKQEYKYNRTSLESSSQQSEEKIHRSNPKSSRDLEPSEADRMADEMLQDLRSKLLMKKNKSSEASNFATEPVQKPHVEKKAVKQSKKSEIVEEKHEIKPKKSKQIEDKELVARKTRILQAEREMTHRKEMARKELKARREKLSENFSDEPDAKVSKKSKVYVQEEVEEEEDDDVLMVSDCTEESISDTNLPASSPGSMDLDEPKNESVHKSNSEKHSDSEESLSLSSEERSRHSRSPSTERRDYSRDSSEHSIEMNDEEQAKKDLLVKASVKEQSLTKEPEPKEKLIVPKANDLPNYFPAIQGCRSVEEFQCLNRIEEGTYGVVYRAKDKRTDEVVALKRLKMEKEKEGFPITSLREINTLLKGQHPNIVTVREIVVGSNMDKIFIVMDYVEHDLKSLIETMKHKKQSFLPGEVKCLLQQLLKAVGHLHDNWILHRDLKTSNLLLSHKGILKVGDFGLAREYGSPLKPYTPIVVTLWYRAPELLLCCKEYSTPIDIWSVGCIFAELLSFHPLFPGKSELDQLNRIFKDLGTPNEKIWPGYRELPAVQKMTFTEYPVSNLRKKFYKHTSELGLALLQGLLTYDPSKRMSAETALKSMFFNELPLPIDPAMFPTWPAKSELGLKKALASSPKPPSGGGEFKRLGEEMNDSVGFMLSGVSFSESRKLDGPGFSLRF